MNKIKVIMRILCIMLWITGIPLLFLLEDLGLQTFNHYDNYDLISYGFAIIGGLLFIGSDSIKGDVKHG